MGLMVKNIFLVYQALSVFEARARSLLFGHLWSRICPLGSHINYLWQYMEHFSSLFRFGFDAKYPLYNYLDH